jgi:thymidine phosphorylase
VKSPGFLRLQAYQSTYWTEQLTTHIRQATATRDNGEAMQKIREVIAAQHATDMLMQYPSNRLKQLDEKRERDTQEPALSRRGPL